MTFTHFVLWNLCTERYSVHTVKNTGKYRRNFGFFIFSAFICYGIRIEGTSVLLQFVRLTPWIIMLAPVLATRTTESRFLAGVC